MPTLNNKPFKALKYVTEPLPSFETVKLEPIFQQLKDELAAGKYDSKTLQQAWKESSDTAHSLSNKEFTGLCPRCELMMFIKSSISAYNNAQTICNVCAVQYVVCKECNTYIHQLDINNPTHKHIKAVPAEAIIASSLAKVEPWNADIMQSNKNHFLMTKDEQQRLTNNKWAGSHKDFTRFFGVEIEVEKQGFAPPDMVDRVLGLLGHFVMTKHDGSLKNHGKDGFEIVSVPATLAYHRSGIWSPFFKFLGPFFEMAPPTTGLHVHLSNSGLSVGTIGKMLVFMNSIKNKEFLEDISERIIGRENPNGKMYMHVNEETKMSDLIKLRQHSSSCPWNPRTKNVSSKYAKAANGNIASDPFGNPIIQNITTSAVSVRATCKCTPGMYNIQKYEAFNLETKRPTVEFRIFRGVIKEEFLYQALEFADALADFCQQTSPKDLGYKDFLKWYTAYSVNGRSKLYPNLSRHLVNKGWLDPAKRAPKAWERPKQSTLEQSGFFA